MSAEVVQSMLALRALEPDEVDALRSSVREVAQAGGGPSFARSLEDGTGFDESTWGVLANDVGLAGLGLPEDVGGIGGLVEVLAVAQELGAELCAVPLLASTVLAGQVLLRCPASDAASAALADIAGGAIATVAFVDAAGRPDLAGVCTARTADDGSVRLDGRAEFVPYGLAAASLIVSVRTSDGLDLALVDPAADGVTRRGLRVLDFSRPQAEITFTDAPATMLTGGGTGGPALLGGLDVALLARAAEQLGAMQRAFDLTLDYIKLRRQFNREIGSFQAIKHRMADALALVEQARSAIERVTWTEPEAGALAEAAAIAAVWCSEALSAVTAEAVQLHGGIGFTWEHDAHLYYRRARSDAVLWGDPTYYRERLATLRNW